MKKIGKRLAAFVMAMLMASMLCVNAFAASTVRTVDYRNNGCQYVTVTLPRKTTVYVHVGYNPVNLYIAPRGISTPGYSKGTLSAQKYHPFTLNKGTYTFTFQRYWGRNTNVVVQW